jgi:hypothetical protein
MPKRVIPKGHEGVENIIDGESCPRGEDLRVKGNDTRFQFYKKAQKK